MPFQKRAKLLGRLWEEVEPLLDGPLCDNWYWILGESADSFSWSALAPNVATERRRSSRGSIDWVVSKWAV